MVYVSAKILPWLMSVLCFLLYPEGSFTRMHLSYVIIKADGKKTNYFPQISIDYHILWSIIKVRNFIIYSYPFCFQILKRLIIDFYENI